jgi:hypothetical protein
MLPPPVAPLVGVLPDDVLPDPVPLCAVEEVAPLCVPLVEPVEPAPLPVLPDAAPDESRALASTN